MKKYREKNKLQFQVRQTMLTDYSFEAVYEAKSIEDYMQSLYSGHLANQLQNLDDNYNQAILLVHGTLDAYIAKAKKEGAKYRMREPLPPSLGHWLGSP